MGKDLVPYEERAVAKGQAVSFGIVFAVAFIVWVASLSPVWLVLGAGYGAFNRFRRASGG